MSCISSDELNFLVFRYLQESGFTHAAFALGYEAGINKSPIDGHKVPLGALIKLVQKGLQYIELEANSDADVDDEFTPIEPIDIITMSVDELRGKIKEQKRAVIEEHDKDMETDKETALVNGTDRGCERDKEADDKGKARERGKEKVEQDKEKEKVIEKEKNAEEHPEKEFPSEFEDRMITSHDENGTSGGPEPMEIANETCEVSSSDVIILEGHTSEVFACAWSPTDSILASGSGDSTARIWNIPCGPSSPLLHTSSVVLKHFKGRTNEKSKDVTTLDWNGDGTLLATGSYDGHARIWGRDGELKNTLSKHKGPIFSLKWNKKGDFLLSGSVDKTAIVWDIKTGECKQQFEFHSAPTLDVDWRNNTSFASCSTDSMIYVCKIGESRPTKAFSGHQGEVNAIKWDPTGSLLASCSDDKTAKIWSLKQDKYVLDFKEHEKEIYTIRWSPTGPGTSNANKQLVLASASFDSTIKLWNVDQGRLLYSLNGHRQPVYSVAFSPSGDYLASGSLDQSLHIWSIRDGRIVRTFHGGGGIFEVCWNREGDKLAACFSNNTVCVVDFRM